MEQHVPTVTLWSGALRQIGYLANPTSLAMTLKHNQIDSLDLAVPNGHYLAQHLITPGARVTVDYRGEQIFSGPMRSYRVSGGKAGMTTTSYESDKRLLWAMRAWPAPASPIGSQNAVYDTASGPAETVLKTVVARNLGHFQSRIPISIAPDLGRGKSVSVKNRFHQVSDVTLAAVDGAGLGVSVVQVKDGLLLDVYQPAVFPVPIVTGEDGTVTDWEVTGEGPSATSFVAGDANTEETRAFMAARNAPREAEWCDVIESFFDVSTGTGLSMEAGLQLADADGRPKAGVKVTLQETDQIHFAGPDGLNLGDSVAMFTAGVEVVDQVVEVSMTWTSQDGLQVTPVAGDISGNTLDKITRAVSQIARRVNALGRG